VSLLVAQSKFKPYKHDTGVGRRGKGGGKGNGNGKGKGRGKGRGGEGREKEKIVALWQANRQIIDFKI